MERVPKHTSDYGEVIGAKLNRSKGTKMEVGNWRNLEKLGIQIRD